MANGDAAPVPQHLNGIMNSIQRIEGYVDGMDRAAFDRSQIVRDAVEGRLVSIGADCLHIVDGDPSFAVNHPNIALQQAIDFSEFLVHEYDAIPESLVWDALQNDLPSLKAAITAFQNQAE